MADPSSHVHVVKLSGPVLDMASVQVLAKQLESARALGHDNLAIDFTDVQRETPQGLAALLELTDKEPAPAIAAFGLSRRLLSAAIDVGLSELLPIYTSAASLQNKTHEPMRGVRALIHEVEGYCGAGWIDIAGRPLLIRQFQWLRALGIEEIVVELCAGPDDSARGAWLLGDDPLISRVTVIPTGAPVGSNGLAQRAGLPADQRVLHVPAHALLGGTLSLDFTRPTRLTLKPPAEVLGPVATLEMRTLADVALIEETTNDAWGMSIEDLGQALDAGSAVMSGHAPGVMMHGLEQEPGLWLARGASIALGARVEAPVFLGVGAMVLDGAHVGPRAVILDGAVIERGASVSEATVAADTLVGEGTRVRRALATPHAFVSFEDATRTSIIDALVLTSRVPTTNWRARTAALVFMILLGLPWLACAAVFRLRSRKVQRTVRARGGVVWHVGTLGLGALDLLPPLLDVLLGTRDLVGVGLESVLVLAARRPHPSALPRAGAIDLTARLTAGATPNTALRVWRWYERRKTNALDRSLWMGREPQG